MDLRLLTDDELMDHIESLVALAGRSGSLHDALDELYDRLHAQATPDNDDLVELAIHRLKLRFGERGDSDGPGGSGVREPRRPSPHAGSATAALEPPRRPSEAA